MNNEFRLNDETYSISLDKSENGYTLTVGDQSLPLNVERFDENTLMLITDGVKKILHVAKTDGKIFVQLDGKVHILEDVLAEEESGSAGGAEIVDGVQKIVAPMPGKLVKITVSEGEKVSKGTTVCIVEAMKMENVVQAKLDGVAKNISFKAGDLVDTENPILEIVSEAS
jgi:biotin carboxyl carrier protein